MVYRPTPPRSAVADSKAGIARTWGQKEDTHGDPDPGLFPDHHSHVQETGTDQTTEKGSGPCLWTAGAHAPKLPVHTRLLICFLVLRTQE